MNAAAVASFAFALLTFELAYQRASAHEEKEFVVRAVSVYVVRNPHVVNVLTLLVGCQERHLVCKCTLQQSLGHLLALLANPGKPGK